MLVAVGAVLALTGFVWHAAVLAGPAMASGTLSFTLGNTASLVGLELALVAILCSVNPALRGLAGGLLMLGGLAALATTDQAVFDGTDAMSWQLQAHVLISILAYGLITVGAIVAAYALVQDRRLHRGQLTEMNALFAPLETNEKLLYGILAAGFVTLLVGVLSGLAFVDDLFAQHLVHKSALSILALLMFAVLLVGRQVAGWRGRKAVYFYLWGYVVLCLAYFGSRYVLEVILERSWG